MLKNTLIIALVIVIIYLYYQPKKTSFLTGTNSLDSSELTQIKQTNQTLVSFLRDNLNSNSLQELKTKLGSKSLNEILEENEDYETEVNTLTRTKNSLEQDLTAQAEAFQARQREKDREITTLKEDLKALEKVREKLTSEKQQHKGSLERIKLLTEQISKLEKEKQELTRSKSPIPGEFPSEDKTKEHQEQLRKLYSLFDLRARGFKEIDFSQLYTLLQKVSKKVDLGKIDK
jgi:DNA repair exonuclease SbcCD ATPase subunit